MSSSSSTTNSHDDTEPILDLLPDDKPRNKKFYDDFVVEPVKDTLSDLPATYPNGIGYPFPLEKQYKEYLLNKNLTRKSFAVNYPAFCGLVRSICNTTTAGLKRPPTIQERNLIAQSLVKEYELLGCGFPSHRALNASMRRRFNNQLYKKKRILLTSDSEETPPKKRRRYVIPRETSGIKKYFI